MNVPPIDPPPRTVTFERRVDPTRLARRITKPDEITTQHRTGVVTAVNTDGTVDVNLAGEVIPDVPTLTAAQVGVPVQLMAWQGDMVALVGGGGPEDLADLDDVTLTSLAANQYIRWNGSAWVNVHGPLGVIGYAPRTSNQTGIGSGDTTLTGLSVTVTVPANRSIRVTGFVSQWNRSGTMAAGDAGYLRIQQDGTLIQQMLHVWPAATPAYTHGTIVQRSTVPSAGSRTFRLVHNRTVGSHTTTLIADSSFPAWIMVEDLGEPA